MNTESKNEIAVSTQPSQRVEIEPVPQSDNAADTHVQRS